MSHAAPRRAASVSTRLAWPDRWRSCAPRRDTSAPGRCDPANHLPSFNLCCCRWRWWWWCWRRSSTWPWSKRQNATITTVTTANNENLKLRKVVLGLRSCAYDGFLRFFSFSLDTHFLRAFREAHRHENKSLADVFSLWGGLLTCSSLIRVFLAHFRFFFVIPPELLFLILLCVARCRFLFDFLSPCVFVFCWKRIE